MPLSIALGPRVFHRELMAPIAMGLTRGADSGSLGFTFSQPRAVADQASTLSLGVNAGIERRELMAVFAVGLCRVTSGDRLPAYYYIDSICRVVKMYWIHAAANTAEVIQYLHGNRANEKCVGRTVGAVISAPEPEAAVPVVVFSCDPQPTWNVVINHRRIYDYLAKKAGKYLRVDRKSVRIVGNHLSLLNRFDGLGFRGLTHREALSF